MSAKPDSIFEKMYAKDRFSQWLGIELLEIDKGFCKLKMTMREEMLNGFGIAHGGISYSFADSAFAFASNSQGRKAVSIETSINHVVALKADDVIVAEASEEALSNKTGVYRIIVSKLNGERVAVFKGMVYRTSKEW